MSLYYKYKFVSPSPIYALVKEELSSYFESGSVDDVLFPKWTDQCLKRLGKSSYSIKETILHIDNFQDKLPDSFLSVKEAWLCTPGDERLYTHPSAEYRNCITSAILVDAENGNPQCPTCGDCEFPQLVQTVYKFTNSEVIRNYGRLYLLKPGNISTQKECNLDCANIGCASPDEFDIHGNKFTTNFRQGIVHLIYYEISRDEEGYQLVPDNYWIQDYIEKYIKYKLFERLSNSVTDETFRQVMLKKAEAKQERDEAFIMADSENKRETVYKQQRAIKRLHAYSKMFEIK